MHEIREGQQDLFKLFYFFSPLVSCAVWLCELGFGEANKATVWIREMGRDQVLQISGPSTYKYMLMSNLNGFMHDLFTLHVLLEGRFAI
jgi:hypothetical protein